MSITASAISKTALGKRRLVNRCALTCFPSNSAAAESTLSMHIVIACALKPALCAPLPLLGLLAFLAQLGRLVVVLAALRL